MCAMMNVWCSYHWATHESWFSPPRDRIQVIRTGSKRLYPLNHLVGTTSLFPYSNHRFSHTVYPVFCLLFQLPPLVESHCVAQGAWNCLSEALLLLPACLGCPRPHPAVLFPWRPQLCTFLASSSATRVSLSLSVPPPPASFTATPSQGLSSLLVSLHPGSPQPPDLSQ